MSQRKDDFVQVHPAGGDLTWNWDRDSVPQFGTLWFTSFCISTPAAHFNPPIFLSDHGVQESFYMEFHENITL